MEAVGELDKHHSHIVGHGDEHLAQALVVQVVFGVGTPQLFVVHAGELGDRVDQAGDLAPEVPLQVFIGDAAVLHHVMEEGSAEGVAIKPEVGQNQSRIEGVFHVGLARAAGLTIVAVAGVGVGGPSIRSTWSSGRYCLTRESKLAGDYIGTYSCGHYRYDMTAYRISL